MPALFAHSLTGSSGIWNEVTGYGLIMGFVVVLAVMSWLGARRRKRRQGKDQQ